MNIPTFKHRDYGVLVKRLKETLNKLQMRDWEVTLVYGPIPPDELRDKWENAGSCAFWTEWLQAVIWINIQECQNQNRDPLHVLLHEIAHIWLAYQDDEERECNILASILQTGLKR